MRDLAQLITMPYCDDDGACGQENRQCQLILPLVHCGNLYKKLAPLAPS